MWRSADGEDTPTVLAGRLKHSLCGIPSAIPLCVHSLCSKLYFFLTDSPDRKICHGFPVLAKRPEGQRQADILWAARNPVSCSRTLRWWNGALTPDLLVEEWTRLITTPHWVRDEEPPKSFLISSVYWSKVKTICCRFTYTCLMCNKIKSLGGCWYPPRCLMEDCPQFQNCSLRRQTGPVYISLAWGWM